MTEFSFPWQCTATGDGGPNSLSLSMVIATNQLLQNNLANSGVVYWARAPYANLLAPSVVSTGTVRIASGVGIVEGWLYTNDADVDFDINAAPGNASATDIIVLQRSLLTQTVRLARISGAVNTKAVLTQREATWEVPIVDVVLDGAGNFSSIADARVLAAPSGSLVKIAEFLITAPFETDITFSNIPPVFTHLRVIGRGQIIGQPTAGIVVALNNDSITGTTAANSTALALTATSAGGIITQADTLISMANSTAGDYFDSFDMVIPNYSQPGFKNIFAVSSFRSLVPDFRVLKGSFWRNKGEIIHTVTIATSFPSSFIFTPGTKFALYGIV